MKKNKRATKFFAILIFLAIILCFTPCIYCFETSKKATWIKPLEEATLTVGKFTYEYTSDIHSYKATLKIIQSNKVLFTDKVGQPAEVTWLNPPRVLEPFQMITTNPKEPPVVMFYSRPGRSRAELQIRIYSTTEPKLLDVLNVGEVGVEVKDIDNDGIVEFEAENCFQLPLPPIDGSIGIYCADAIYHFSKGKFKLAKGGELKSTFLNSAKQHWQAFEKVHNKLVEIKKRGEDWNKIREKEKHSYGSYRVMMGNLAGWLVQIESTADQEKIKEALEKLRKMSFLLEKEKTGLIECLVEAGYSGLALKE